MSKKSQAFDSKSVLQRSFVIIAGPLANFIFAILLIGSFTFMECQRLNQ